MVNPLVSILMTCYNRQQFIVEAIESVLAATYPYWELIIVDDGSSDNTLAIARKYESEDHRIKVYANHNNLGDYPNRNKAAEYASGDYLIWVDSDDTMFPTSLQNWIIAVRDNKARFAIFTQACIEIATVYSSKDVIFHHLFINPVLNFGPGATMIERKLFMDIGGFPTEYGPANDSYHHLKIASSVPVLLMSIPISDYRLHAGQEINNAYSYLYNNYRYLKDAILELNLQLTQEQKQFLLQKNRRRFVVNCFNHLKKTRSLGKTLQAIRIAQFTLGDLTSALFSKRISKTNLF